MKERNESHSFIIVENNEETMMNRKRDKGFQTERKRDVNDVYVLSN